MVACRQMENEVAVARQVCAARRAPGHRRQTVVCTRTQRSLRGRGWGAWSVRVRTLLFHVEGDFLG